MKRVTGKHQRGWQFLFYLAVLLCVAALGVIGLYGYGQYQANEQYHGLRQLGEVPDKEAVEILRKAVVTEGKTERDEGGEAVQKVDFKALHQVNPEICAWIQMMDFIWIIILPDWRRFPEVFIWSVQTAVTLRIL